MSGVATVCQMCGNPLSSDDVFCRKCGAAVTASGKTDASGIGTTRAALVALAFAVLAFGVAASIQVACGPEPPSCQEPMLAPTVLLTAADLLLLCTVLQAVWRRVAAPVAWLVAGLALVAAASSMFVGVLWLGVFANQYFGDQTNPWRDTAAALPARVLVLYFDYGSRRVLWTGTEVGHFVGISLLVAGFVGAAISLAALALALIRRPRARVPSLRAVVRRPFPGVVILLVALALVVHAVVAVPAIAAQQSDRRATIRLNVAYSELDGAVTDARDRYRRVLSANADPDTARIGYGRASGDANRKFDAAVRLIPFPERVLSNLASLRRADADVIAASDALGGDGNVAALLRTLDLVRQEQYAAYSALAGALVPPRP